MRGAFETWIDPLDLETFRDEYFSKRTLYRAPSPERLETMLAVHSWDVDELLRIPGVKVLAWFNALNGGHLTAEVSSEAARKLYRGGTTLYLQEVPALEAIGDEIARALKVPRHNIVCALFCNQRGARTRAHFDPVDTITLQLKGSKRWRVAANELTPDPTTSWGTLDGSSKKAELWQYGHDELPKSMPAGAEELFLEPGAVLNVPLGFWHETESDEESVSLHIHRVPLPWVDAVLVSLRALLLRERPWRESANHLWNPARAAANEQTAEELLRALVDTAGRLTADDVLPVPRPVPSGSPPGRWVRRARAGFVVEGRSAETGVVKATIAVADYGAERRTTLEMSDAYLQACRLFLECPAGGPLAAADLAERVTGLDLDDANLLVDRLLDAGFLRAA